MSVLFVGLVIRSRRIRFKIIFGFRKLCRLGSDKKKPLAVCYKMFAISFLIEHIFFECPTGLNGLKS